MAFGGKSSGKPTELAYDAAIGERICKQIAAGKSLKTIMESDDKIPEYRIIMTWLREEPTFSQMYADAREQRADHLFEETLEISDHGTNDWMAKNDPNNPGYAVNGEHISRSRLRVDTRKWAAAKLNPKKYGEKIEHSSDPERPLGLGAIIVPAKDFLQHLSRAVETNNGNGKVLEYYTHDESNKRPKHKKKK